MRQWKIAPAVSAAAGMLLVAAAPGQAQAVADARPAAQAWVSGTFPEGAANLQGATRVGAHTTWAVGYRRHGEGKEVYSSPLIVSKEDGSTRWRELGVPDGFYEVRTVTAGSAGTTWVTDTARDNDGGIRTARHGGTGWRTAEAPLPEGSLTGGFNALAPVAADDVWAVGWSQPADYTTYLGLIEHWDGTRWQRVRTPAVNDDYWTLNDVVASGPDDIWATGTIGTPEGHPRPLMMHYDGSEWTIASTPELSSEYGEFVDLEARGPNDVWAVGGTRTGADEKNRTAVAHFDGRGWTKLDTGAGSGRLTSVTSTPAGIVAVGYSTAGGVILPLGVRQTSTGWKPLDIPAIDGGGRRHPVDVLSAGRKLSVVGVDTRVDAVTGESLPATPFGLTTR
ncbi:hypothetical protein [Streptomyces sp. NPDC002666]